MSFFLFLLATATLFVRPAEIVTDLEALPIYEWLIVACMTTSLPLVLTQLNREALAQQPITVCVLGLLAAVFLSHASHGDLWSARYDAIEFSKAVIFYLLLVANVNSAGRLHAFLCWLLGCITVCTTLAVMQYHGVIEIPSLAAYHDTVTDYKTGTREIVARLCSTGLFHDPNDLSMLLVVGMALAGYFFFDRKMIQMKLALAACAGLFFYALLLTKSRGGLLALMAALGALFQARFGWKKSLVLGGLCLPLVAVLVGGRQADIGGAIGDGTGQTRIQLWSAGLGMFRNAPLFGVGHGLYSDEAGQVAHNSYIHAFAELGVFGGAMFLGAFYYALRTLYRLGQGVPRLSDLDQARLRPFLLSAVAGYATSMLTLSRAYVAPTYLLIGLPAVYLNVFRVNPLLATQFDSKLVKDLAKASVVFLIGIYLFVRVFARWSG